MATMGRVRVSSTGYTGAPGLSTFHFAVAVGDFDSVAADLAADRVLSAYTAAAAMFAATQTFSFAGIVDVLDVESGDLIGAESAATWSVTGPGGNTAVGPSPAGVLTRYITAGTVNSHHVKGRTFHVPVYPGVFEANGSLSTSGLTLSGAFGDAITDAGATDCVFGVWSRPVDAEHATAGSPVRSGSFHGVTGYGVPDKAIVLRSRRD